MNVRELIEQLKGMPESASVAVLVNGSFRHEIVAASLGMGDENPVVVIAVRPSVEKAMRSS